jgi:superfamily II DNA or RNA helicase
LFKNIDPLEMMHEFLREQYPQFTYHVIKGDVSVDDREDIRKSIEYSTGHIILATYGCMKQGVNIKLLHNLIFANPAKSVYMVVQSIGRIVRPHKDKKMAYVYDLVDDASYEYIGRSGYPVVKTNYMVKHYDIRRSYYDDDEIPVEEINFTGIYEAKIDEAVIAERKRKAADKAKAKAEKVANKVKVFKNKFFL